MDQDPQRALHGLGRGRHGCRVDRRRAFTAVGIVVRDSPPAATAVAIDPSGGTLSGTGLAQLAVIAFGVVAVTGEYRTRMIRSSLAAVPTRLPLVWGKAAAVAASAAVVSLAALLLSFLVASSSWPPKACPSHSSHPGWREP